MSSEGEFKKRLKRPYNELLWQRFAYTHKKEDGSFPQQDEYIDMVIEDAKKEIFQNIKLVTSDKFHGFIIENDEKMIEILKKWFGESEK